MHATLEFGVLGRRRTLFPLDGDEDRRGRVGAAGGMRRGTIDIVRDIGFGWSPLRRESRWGDP